MKWSRLNNFIETIFVYMEASYIYEFAFLFNSKGSLLETGEMALVNLAGRTDCVGGARFWIPARSRRLEDVMARSVVRCLGKWNQRWRSRGGACIPVTAGFLPRPPPPRPAHTLHLVESRQLVSVRIADSLGSQKYARHTRTPTEISSDNDFLFKKS